VQNSDPCQYIYCLLRHLLKIIYRRGDLEICGFFCNSFIDEAVVISG